MKKKGALKYKWQISIMTLVFFCLSLVPFPNGVVDALAETILKSPVINSDGTVTFNYQGDGTEKAVKVKGEFSGWNTIDMIKEDNDIWTTTVEGISGIRGKDHTYPQPSKEHDQGLSRRRPDLFTGTDSDQLGKMSGPG